MPVILTEYFMSKSLFEVKLFKKANKDKILFKGIYNSSKKLISALIVKDKVYSHYYLFDLKELGISSYFKLYENINSTKKIDINSQIDILNTYKSKYKDEASIDKKNLLVLEAINYFGKEASFFVEYALTKGLNTTLLNQAIIHSCKSNNFGQEPFPLKILYKNIGKQRLSNEAILRLLKVCHSQEKLNKLEIQTLTKNLIFNYCSSNTGDINIFKNIRLYKKEKLNKDDLIFIKDTIKPCNETKQLLLKSVFSLKIDNNISINNMTKSEIEELLENIDIKTNENIFFKAIKYVDKNFILEKLYNNHFTPDYNQTNQLVDIFLKPEYQNTSLFGFKISHNPKEYEKQFYILSLLNNSRRNNINTNIALKMIHKALESNSKIEKSLLLLGLTVLGEEKYFNESLRVSNVDLSNSVKSADSDIKISLKLVRLVLGKNLKSIILSIGQQLGCTNENIIQLSKNNLLRIKDICKKDNSI